MTNNNIGILVIVIILILALAATFLITWRKIKSTLREIGDPELMDRETGLFKSDHFFDLASASVDLFERYGAPFTLLIFNFYTTQLKKMNPNDRNATLEKLGQKVRMAIRATDKAGRPSSDSIAIMLFNTVGGDSKPVVSRVKAAFNKVLPDSHVRVTVWTTPSDIDLIRMYAQGSQNLGTKPKATDPRPETPDTEG